jgi:MFS family permease
MRVVLSRLALLLTGLLGFLRRWIEEGARTGGRRLELHLGGRQRTQVIVLLAGVLALASADTATVGASATQLRAALHISNTDIGLLVAVNAATAAVFSIPFGFIADRFRRTRILSISVFLWGLAMLWSATAGSFDKLLLARVALGVVTAVAGPVVASLIGDYFPSTERGRIYGYVLTGELLGAGFGFAVTGDIAALSWRAAFVILALPTFVLARLLLRLPEPARGNLAPLQPQVVSSQSPGTGSSAGSATSGDADPTVVVSANPAPWLTQPASPSRYADPDPRRVDPRYPAPGYSDPRRADPYRADPYRADPYRAEPYRDGTGQLDPRFPSPGYTDSRSAGFGSSEAGPPAYPDARYPGTGYGDRTTQLPSAPGGVPGPPTVGSGDDAADGAPKATDAQRLAQEKGITADDERAAQLAAPMGLVSTIRHLLAIRTNAVLIVASALGYFYLAGIQTFAIEFTKEQYGVNQAVSNLLLLVIGVGAVLGVLLSGPLSDRMLQNGRLNSRIGTTTVLAGVSVVMFIPALITRNATTALPYLVIAAFALSAQNPPIDAARLDIVPAPLWGRAEGLRTALRTAAQSVAPIAFGGISDLFGAGRSGLQWAFLIMLLPLAGNAYVLFRSMKSYPGDVATAAAATLARPPVPPTSNRRSSRRRGKEEPRRSSGRAASPTPTPTGYPSSATSPESEYPSPARYPASPPPPYPDSAPARSTDPEPETVWPRPPEQRPASGWPQPTETRPGPGWRPPDDPPAEPARPRTEDRPHWF